MPIAAGALLAIACGEGHQPRAAGGRSMTSTTSTTSTASTSRGASAVGKPTLGGDEAPGVAMTSGNSVAGGAPTGSVGDNASASSDPSTDSRGLDAGTGDSRTDAPRPANAEVDSGVGGAGTDGRDDTTSTSASAYPCDGSTDGYAATAVFEGGTWTVRRDGNILTTSDSMLDAMQAAMDSLSPGRSAKQAVLVQGSGNIDANARPDIPSYTILNVCGTIDVTGNNTQSDRAPVYARGRSDIEIPNVNITGAPGYAMFFRDVDNLTLGNVDLRLSAGEGIRIDNHGRADRSVKAQHIAIEHVYVSGTGHHGVETYGVDDITIGTIIARNTTNCGLLLNDTTNAEVGLVDGEDVATGTGYAVFRMANRNGRVNGSYPTNIHVGEVRARRGGRGIFCVSESGGAVIDRVDIADTGSQAILIENCYNVTIAAVSGTVVGPGDIRIAARPEFPTTSGVTFSNLALNNTDITENPCGTNNRAVGVTPMGAVNMCD